MTPRYDFASDTTAPMTPEALAALLAVNSGYAPSYGADPATTQAADLIRGLLDADAEVRFVSSATAANAICLAALCRPFESVLCHQHAHVLTHEAGAPGFFGQGLGLVGLPGASGKVDPAALEAALGQAEVSYLQPSAALSLTNTTEYAAVYSTNEASRLGGMAKDRGLGVHLDGARLVNAAVAGFDLKTIKTYIDLLVFGGAKAGMPGTEAIVVFDKTLARRLDARLKQSGQLPSKSRFNAAPFVGMFQDGAAFRYASHANAMAAKLAAASPFPIAHPVQSNAVFMHMDEAAHSALQAKGWLVHRVLDGSVRFTTAWATTAEAVEELSADLAALG
jgi:threonine aldolase